MTKFHSTVSRRDFMKGLGLATGGLGAVSVVGPKFHDLDELLASGDIGVKNPWWVKKTDNPTIEIDWNIMQPIDIRKSPSHGHDKSEWAAYVGGEHIRQQHSSDQAARQKEHQAQRRDDYTLRALALKTGMGNGGSWNTTPPNVGFLGLRKAPTPEERGMPKWQGSPEENSRMITAALRHFGAPSIGLLELNPNTTRKLIYGYEFDSDIAYKWEDVADGYEQFDQGQAAGTGSTGKRVIPQQCRWGFTWTFNQSTLGIKVGLSADRYNRGRHQQYQMQEFIRGLGYQAYGPYRYPNNLGNQSGMGVMSGLGEIGRNNLLISPTLPATMATGSKLVTNLELAPGSPIDAGIHKFCKTCKVCAETCPGDALGIETEPEWDTTGSWNNPGIKHWRFKAGYCFTFSDIDPCKSAGCQKWCTFASEDNAMIHDIIRATVASTPIFNGFFTDMHLNFGYGPRSFEDWWAAELPPYGVDTTRAIRYA